MAAEHHVDADSTRVFASVYGEWMMFGWTYRIACGASDSSSTATQGVVRVLDER